MRIIVPACASTLMVMAGTTILCLNAPKPPQPLQAMAELASPAPIVLANLPWDRAHCVELVTLKSHADAFMIAGTYRQASDVYQLILNLTADREVTDPVAAEIVNSARERQTKVLVLARAAEQAASTSVATVQVHTIPVPTEALPVTGPPDATATVTEGGHTYQMGSPDGKRFIWGVGTGPVVGHANK